MRRAEEKKVSSTGDSWREDTASLREGMWRVDLGFRVGEEKRVLGVKGVLEGGEEKRVLEGGEEKRVLEGGEDKRVLGVKGVLERDEEKRVLERGGEARMGMA